jgi:hypothetical protein
MTTLAREEPHGIEHPLCDNCWDAGEPDSPSPRTAVGDLEWCCRCGESTRSGIFVRAELSEMPQCPDHGIRRTRG